MPKSIRKILLAWALTSFVWANSFCLAGDYDYKQPNYNNPTKPNYMRGTRTDMGPKVEVPTGEKKEEKFCEPSERIKKEFNRLEDQRGDKSEIILFSDTVSGYRRLQEDWDKECAEKEKNKDKTSSQPVLNPAE